MTTIYTAWMWRDDPFLNPPPEKRESRFRSLVSARVALTQWLADWPEATEYGIDHDTPDGPVADFLSSAIQERMLAIREEQE